MINFELERQKGLLYAKMPEHKYLVQKTKKFIEWSLKQVSNPYVACSFGKDSAVMTHLICSIDLSIPVVFAISEETFLIDNYQEVIHDWKSEMWLSDLTILYCKREEDGRTHTSEKMSTNTIHDSYFVGLRKDESKDRRISLSKYGKFHKKKDGKIRIAPLSDWTDKDVFAYMFDKGLPFLDTYKAFGSKARTTSVVPTKGRERMLSQLKFRNPSAYNQTLNIINTDV